MKKTIFLTGAAGFIGSNFLKYMFEKYREHHFIILDSLTYAGNSENIPGYIKKSKRFEFWYGTVTNPDIVQSLMCRADWVVHFAAESHVARSIFDNSRFFETDVIGTQVMMNALLRNSHVERFIHISTSEVYGTALHKPMTEEHPLNPMSPYAGAKVGADRLVYSYWSTYDIPVVIVRPFNNYGPQQHLEKMVARFITSAIKQEVLTIHGDGTARRDWLHVDDHCSALDRVLHIDDFRTIKNKVINIGTGVATSVLQIAEQILHVFRLPITMLKFVGDRPGQVNYHVSSIDRAEKLLGWKSKISLERGIPMVIQWYKENKDWWKGIEWMKQVPVYTKNNIVEMH